MKKKIIAIKGPQNSGKTTLINTLLVLLSRICNDIDQYGNRERHVWCGDSKAIVTIKGRKMAICPKGDDDGAVRISFGHFEECDILILAVRTDCSTDPSAENEYDKQIAGYKSNGVKVLELKTMREVIKRGDKEEPLFGKKSNGTRTYANVALLEKIWSEIFPKRHKKSK